VREHKRPRRLLQHARIVLDLLLDQKSAQVMSMLVPGTSVLDGRVTLSARRKLVRFAKSDVSNRFHGPKRHPRVCNAATELPISSSRCLVRHCSSLALVNIRQSGGEQMCRQTELLASQAGHTHLLSAHSRCKHVREHTGRKVANLNSICQTATTSVVGESTLANPPHSCTQRADRG
jgi:hypothetical protein